jgi:hypothetical protein
MAPTDTVKNTGTHPVDLADGRPLAPGETATDVDLNDPHNADLEEQGLLSVEGGAKALKREQNTDEIKAAAEAGRHHGARPGADEKREG